MKVCWVISEEAPDDQLPLGELTTIAEAWGSWRTYKEYKTDNCICSNTNNANYLTKRGFQKSCNLYLLQDSHIAVGKPPGVKLFAGQFGSDNVANKDDIVALNLAVPQYDLVLLFGFNLTPSTDASRDEYIFNVKEIIKANDNVQFVLVDYEHEIDSEILELDNVTSDTVESVVSLLGQ